MSMLNKFTTEIWSYTIKLSFFAIDTGLQFTTRFSRKRQESGISITKVPFLSRLTLSDAQSYCIHTSVLQWNNRPYSTNFNILNILVTQTVHTQRNKKEPLKSKLYILIVSLIRTVWHKRYVSVTTRYRHGVHSLRHARW